MTKKSSMKSHTRVKWPKIILGPKLSFEEKYFFETWNCIYLRTNYSKIQVMIIWLFLFHNSLTIFHFFDLMWVVFPRGFCIRWVQQEEELYFRYNVTKDPISQCCIWHYIAKRIWKLNKRILTEPKIYHKIKQLSFTTEIFVLSLRRLNVSVENSRTVKRMCLQCKQKNRNFRSLLSKPLHWCGISTYRTFDRIVKDLP